MQKELEHQVEQTAAKVAECRGTIARIGAQLETANLARANAKKIREANALKSATGDATAIAAIKAARAEQLAAEQTRVDLKIALPEMEAQLAAAEKAAASARHELAMLHGRALMRQRVAAAARMDAAFAESAAAYADFERLGRELQSFPDLNIAVSGNMSHWETVTGYRRIASALPMFFLKLFPTTWSNEAPRTSLAASEAHFWQLAPEHDEKSKAA
jgi:hypothetical protein